MLAAVLCASMTPIHRARFDAAARRGQDLGHRLAAIEVADSQSDYNWPRRYAPKISEGFDLTTLFSDVDYWKVGTVETALKLYRTLTSVRPDVVVIPGWVYKESWAALTWCLGRSTPRVLICDTQPIDRPARIGRTMVKKAIVRRYQAALVGGRPHTRYLHSLGLPPSRCFSGCDVVDNDMFDNASSNPAKPGPSRGRLLTCARLVPEKNLEMMVEVMSRVRDQWTWTICGYGPLRDPLEQQVNAAGLEDTVTFVPGVSYWDMPTIYPQANVYIQPSLSEAWGMAVNEALAAGLPVLVSTQCGCHEDLVVPGINGLTFAPKDPGSLVTALRWMSDHRGNWGAMGRASKQIIAGWGLDHYAANFWRACAMAMESRTDQIRGVGR
jgi:glycosyltransferase involved in cell wall biosynthesis